MNKTLVLLYMTILTTTVRIQASMLSLDVRTEQKVKCEFRKSHYDKAAQAKKARRALNLDRQWAMRQLQRAQQQALAHANNDEELCSGSCGCLGRDKRRDCLASGFSLPLIGYMLKFFGL